MDKVANKLILTLSEEAYKEYWVGYINDQGDKIFTIVREVEYDVALGVFKDLN